MTLAQVVYNISTDKDFAAQWHSNPEAALAERGFNLSKEELDFLSIGLRRSDLGSERVLRFKEAPDGSSWM